MFDLESAPTRARPRGPSRSVTLLACATLALTGCSPVASRVAEATTESGDVVAVVDGDTIDVVTSEERVRVRLIGIDTPETGRDGKVRECYANEARDFLNELLYARTVQLRADASQADVDKYGRLLRHVLVDEQSAAVLAISAGAGHEYTYNTPYVDRDAHLAAQDAAAAAGAGLWSTCN
jgi:micrococcal nuclease